MRDLIHGGRLAATTAGLVAVGLLAGLFSPASAAPAGVTDAIEGLEADILLYGGAITGLVLLSIGFGLGWKYMYKGKSKG